MKYIEINWLLAFASLILTIVIFFNSKLDNYLYNFISSYKDLFFSYYETKDDEEKFKNILKNLKKIFFSSLKLFITFIIIISPIILFYIFGAYNNIDINQYILSIEIFLISLITYLVGLKFKKKKNQYNRYDRIIHNLILNNKLILNLTLDLEDKIFRKKKNNIKKKLFICGYARSGTTTVLNSLYNSGQFDSLLYNNLPFALSPRINKFFLKFSRLENQDLENKRERSHKDGIFIDKNSPEAFEEIFWKTKLKNDYVKKYYLKKNNISDEIIHEFENYIELINNKNKTYLSKNNNNILRIEHLSSIENSNIFILIREPFSHSKSLLKQHINFLNQQNNDKFVLEYMNSLGHYEFGQNQKSFFSPGKYSEKTKLIYWLSEWQKTYKNILDEFNQNKKNNVFFVTYEGLCENPEKLFNKVEELYDLNLEYKQSNFTNYNLYKKEQNFSNEETLLLEDCQKLYKIIKDKSII